MNRPNRTQESENARPSRFVYHTDVEEDGDPGEGGVHAVVPTEADGDAGGAAGHRFIPSGRTGEPSPEDLLLDISELARTTGMRYKHTFSLAPRSAEFVEIVSPQTGTISLTNTGAVLLIQGGVEADLALECGRCLETTVQRVKAEIEEDFELVAKRNAFNQEEVEAVDEDAPAAVISGNILNLGELVRQSLLLAAPPQPLCREDCPGVLVNGRPLIAPVGGDATETDGSTAEARANPLRGLGALIQQRFGSEDADAKTTADSDNDKTIRSNEEN